MSDGPKVAAIVLAILLPLLGLGLYLFERRHGASRRRGREPERLPLFGTDQLSIRALSGGTTHDDVEPAPAPRPAPPPRPAPRPAAPRPAPPPPAPAPVARRPEVTPAPPPPPAPAPAATPAPAPAPVPSFASAPTAEHPIARPSAPRPSPVAAPMPMPSPIGQLTATDTALIDGETLRFVVPADGTVEFLPGRLEVIAGPEAGREIRFARAVGETDVEVTFGRSEGLANRHIQILARTVSRRHAVMSLIDEHWQLTNLSSTNPIVLNGRVLAGNEVAPLLVEGDRIEMGEVAFIFHDA